jgi:hypothetical protein
VGRKIETSRILASAPMKIWLALQKEDDDWHIPRCFNFSSHEEVQSMSWKTRQMNMGEILAQPLISENSGFRADEDLASSPKGGR